MVVVTKSSIGLLTAAEYGALDGTTFGDTELVEGRLSLSPEPEWQHKLAAHELLVQLRPQLPEHLTLLANTYVDLELNPADAPGFVRRPDLVVTRDTETSRAGRSDGLLPAAEVLIVIEVVSPSSVRTDYVTKRGEYADADIPHYWIVDIEQPISLLACDQAADLGYVDTGEYRTHFTTDTPINTHLNLDTLL